jgi:hypothetical protein
MDMLGRDDDAIRAETYAREGHPLALLVRLRREAAIHVEALLAFLDATEGDIEIADDAEQSLQMIREAARLCDDRTDDDEDGADREPSLGFSEPVLTHDDRGYWFQYYSNDAAQPEHHGASDDREDDRSDLEPSLCGIGAHWVPSASGVEDGELEADDEPSLGSVDPIVWGKGQELWAQGEGIDLEDEHDGSEEGHDVEAVNEDGDGDADMEPSLGWPERLVQGVDPGSSSDCELSPPLSVTDDDRRQFFRRRHGNVKPIPAAAWVVA